MSTAAAAKRSLLPEVSASSFTPSAVISKTHAITTAMGKPSNAIRIKMRSAHGGASNAGNPMEAACTASHATTK